MDKSRLFNCLVVGLTFLTTMLMPQSAHAGDFISEVCVSTATPADGPQTDNIAKQQLTDAGYTCTDIKCNEGSTSNQSVRIGYKTSDDMAEAITGLLVVYGEYKDKPDATVEYDGKTYHRAASLGSFFLNGDLNIGYIIGTKPIYLFYTKDGNTADCTTLLTSLDVSATKPAGSTGVGSLNGESFNADGVTYFAGSDKRAFITYTQSHYHSFKATWAWADDLESATATLACEHCSVKYEDLSASVSSDVTAQPTCTVAGEIEYTASVTDPGRSADSYNDQKTAPVAALGHDFATFKSWTWAEGYTAAHATFGCTRCTETHDVEAAVSTNRLKDPTCTEAGKDEHTATAVNPSTKENVTDTKTSIPEALGHYYDALNSWTWDAADLDHVKATASLSCGRNACNHIEGFAATVEYKGIYQPATCTDDGLHQYSATVTSPSTGEKFTDTHYPSIPKLGHHFEELVSWNCTSGTSASAKFRCTRENCGTTSDFAADIHDDGITSDATCEKEGKHQYTASLNNPVTGEPLSNTYDVVIEPLGHIFEIFDRWTWTVDNEPGAYFICSRCNKSSNKYPAKSNNYETILECTCSHNGKRLYQASISNPVHPEQMYYDEHVGFTPAYDHRPGIFEDHCEDCGADLRDYLSFTAVDGDITVDLYSKAIDELFYSIDKSTRIPFEKSVDVPKGETIYVGCYEEGGFKPGNHFVFTSKVEGEGKVAIGGNVMSLLDPKLCSNTVPARFFEQMFNVGDGFLKSNAMILSAPKMPALNLGYRCYEYMFYGSSNLKATPELPAKYISNQSYDCMFEGCTSGNVTATVPFDVVNNLSSQLSKISCNIVCKDGDITLTDYEGYNVKCDIDVDKVTYKRDMTSEWGTLCLPFEIAVDDTNPYDFYDISAVNDNELVVTKIITAVAAGQPVLVRLKDSVQGINISKENPTLSSQTSKGNLVGGMQLYGTYTKKDLSAEEGYIMAKDMFRDISQLSNDGPVMVAPFRAWIHGTKGTTGANALGIYTDDDATTGIETIDAITSGNAEFYDINGRRVSQLQKGINIIRYGDGMTKKVVVK